MIKICIILSLAIASAYGQASAPGSVQGGEAAPEPYSYAYETDTHAAAEQKDPNGRVTGYYTLTDADGRARRVEYVADETGFHAKVQTNEVGTKSENSADVEVLASPPTREQLVYQQSPAVQSQVAQQQQQTFATVAQQSAAPVGVQQGYSQYGYGHYPGYMASQYGYTSPSYVYSSPYNGYSSSSYAYSSPSYGYVKPVYGVAGYGAYGNGLYSSNNLASSYYRSAQSVAGVQPSSYSSVSSVRPSSYSSVSSVQPSSYSSGNVASRYVVSNPVVGAVGSSYHTVGVPVGVGYQSSLVNPQRVSYTSPVGSSNYIVLKKRESEKSAQKEAESDKQ